MEGEQVAANLLGRTGKLNMVFLVTVGKDGRPDARAISVVKYDGISTVWMLTGKCSDKYAELSKDPHCMLYATEFEYGDDYMELRLWGSAELLDDPASLEFAWKDEYINFFPGGKTDPNLVAVKFTADSGVLQTVSAKEALSL